MVINSEYLLKELENEVMREIIIDEIRHQELMKLLKQLEDDVMKSLK